MAGWTQAGLEKLRHWMMNIVRESAVKWLNKRFDPGRGQMRKTANTQAGCMNQEGTVGKDAYTNWLSPRGHLEFTQRAAGIRSLLLAFLLLKPALKTQEQ